MYVYTENGLCVFRTHIWLSWNLLCSNIMYLRVITVEIWKTGIRHLNQLSERHIFWHLDESIKVVERFSFEQCTSWSWCVKSNGNIQIFQQTGWKTQYINQSKRGRFSSGAHFLQQATKKDLSLMLAKYFHLIIPDCSWKWHALIKQRLTVSLLFPGHIPKSGNKDGQN